MLSSLSEVPRAVSYRRRKWVYAAGPKGGAEKEGQLWNRCDRDYDDAPKGVRAFGADWRISRGSRRNDSLLTFLTPVVPLSCGGLGDRRRFGGPDVPKNRW